MKILIIILISLPCYSQIAISSITGYTNKPVYGVDIRYIESLQLQEIHYGTRVTNDYATVIVSGYQGKALKWGFGCAFTKYKENLSVSYNPLLSYSKKRLFVEAGTMIRVAYFGEHRSRWNHFLTMGIKLK